MKPCRARSCCRRSRRCRRTSPGWRITSPRCRACSGWRTSRFTPRPCPPNGSRASCARRGEILCAGKAFSFAAQPALYWHVDVEAVVQVGENLLSNAARYARTRVTMCVEARGGALEVCVADDGCGFTPDGLEKATEPFYRAEGSGEGHLGLGLNICRILCERHGGGVSVENGEDGGAVVRARFALGWGEGAEHGEM